MANENEKPAELSKELQSDYELVGVNPGRAIVKTKNGRKEVDFTKMTKAEAEKLIEAECTNIVRKKATQGPTTNKTL